MSSSNPIERLRSSIGVRIAAGYGLLVLLSFFLLWAIAYGFLTSTLTRNDRAQVQLELQSLRDQYLAGGLQAFEAAVIDNDRFRKNNPFFTRIRPPHAAAKVYFPQYWHEFDLSLLDPGHAPGADGWFRLPAREADYDLEILTAEFADGFAFEIGINTQDRQAVLRFLRDGFFFVGLPLLGLCLAGGALLAKRSLRPVRQLIRTVESIHGGSWEARTARTGRGDELDELGRLFNDLIEKIHLLIRGMQNALDNVAHDLRTPMTHFLHRAEKALRPDADASELRIALQDCVEESEQILRMLTMLMDISEAETGALQLNRRRVDLTTLAGKVADMYRYVAQEKGVTLDCECAEELHVTVDPERLSQALANLLDNAVKYTPEGGRIRLRLAAAETGVAIEVIDSGCGIDPADLEQIWNRLYRGGRREARGIGLGLSLVRAITLAHGGMVKAENRPEGGARFQLLLPPEAVG